jgi:plastocyanin
MKLLAPAPVLGETRPATPDTRRACVRAVQRLGTAIVLSSGLMLTACGGQQDAPPAQQTTPVSEPVDAATAGSVAGKVTFSGTAPARAPITMAADPKCVPEGGSAAAETVMVGDGGALQNVFVYVKDGLGQRVFPAPATPVVLDQKGCTYRPHVFGVRVGQPIEILNSDATLHNIHAMPAVNQEFNNGQPPQGAPHQHIFSAKEVMVPFKCDVHRWMRAYAGVLDHPFYAVTGADGTFSLAGLPPGTYTIEAWHETLGTKLETVTVGAKEAKALAFSFAG